MLVKLDEHIFREYMQWNALALEQGATLEDYRTALEKTKPKKPKINGYEYTCPCCTNVVGVIDDYSEKYCSECGQKLDWSEGEQNEEG